MYNIEEFSSAEMQLYEKRFEEGYNISDPRYENWLDIYHPNTKICGSSEDICGMYVLLHTCYS